MVYLTRKAEFSASHYYHNPDFTPEENRRIFGKCNNPNGHGHNYTLEVTAKSSTPWTTASSTKKSPNFSPRFRPQKIWQSPAGSAWNSNSRQPACTGCASTKLQTSSSISTEKRADRLG